MDNNIIYSLNSGERVSSTYAEIYFDDDYCETEIKKNEPSPAMVSKRKQTITIQNIFKDEWISPSDLLIGKLELKPPFTSKITRGTTHEGILAIGNNILANERAKFVTELSHLISNNEAAWKNILSYEKKMVDKKVKKIYEQIFSAKSKTMAQEISKFYESSLQELENNLSSEIKGVLISAHANIISDLNNEIKQKLQYEREKLENILENIYKNEVSKIKQYYTILLQNEQYRNDNLVRRTLCDKDDALKAFYRQIEAETITSTMYVMSIERKKCRIKQFILENYQAAEIKEKLESIKERQELIDAYKQREECVSEINLEWETKIKKVVQIFLKFISYCLKLLPEQSTFLLDLEKMVVLQLNEIQKMPKKALSVLVEAEEVLNTFKFEQTVSHIPPCGKKPFEIVGDLSDPVPPKYGSRETLTSDVDLPLIRLQRQFIYAKCHKYEEVKTFLEAHRCKCSDFPNDSPSDKVVPTIEEPILTKSNDTGSSNERLTIEDIKRYEGCPVSICQDWVKSLSFPELNSYLDYTEENFKRVQAIIGTPRAKKLPLKLIKAKDIAHSNLPFAATTEFYNHAETQYSSQEDVSIYDTECPCNAPPVKQHDSQIKIKQSKSKVINEITTKRINSMRRILNDNPKLLEMFTDESFDFRL